MTSPGRHAAASRTGPVAAALLLIAVGLAAAVCAGVLDALDGGARGLAGALGAWGVLVGAVGLRHGLRRPTSP